MKNFRCEDIGMDCSFEAQAANEKDLMKEVKEHVKSAHNMQRIDPETANRLHAAITDEDVEGEEVRPSSVR
jgi:predicted small metal-binding protein